MDENIGVKIKLLPVIEAADVQSAVDKISGVKLNIGSVAVDGKALHDVTSSIEKTAESSKPKIKLNIDTKQGVDAVKSITDAVRNTLQGRSISGSALNRAMKDVGDTASATIKKVDSVRTSMDGAGRLNVSVKGTDELQRAVTLSMQYDTIEGDMLKHSVTLNDSFKQRATAVQSVVKAQNELIAAQNKMFAAQKQGNTDTDEYAVIVGDYFTKLSAYNDQKLALGELSDAESALLQKGDALIANSVDLGQAMVRDAEAARQDAAAKSDQKAKVDALVKSFNELKAAQSAFDKTKAPVDSTEYQQLEAAVNNAKASFAENAKALNIDVDVSSLRSLDDAVNQVRNGLNSLGETGALAKLENGARSAAESFKLLRAKTVDVFNGSATDLTSQYESLSGNKNIAGDARLQELLLKIEDIKSKTAQLGTAGQQDFARLSGEIRQTTKEANDLAAELDKAAKGIKTDMTPVHNLMRQLSSFRTNNTKIIGTQYETALNGIAERLNGITREGQYTDDAIKKIREEFAQLGAEVNAAGMGGRSFFKEITGVLKGVGQSMVVRNLFMYAKQGAREMYNAVKEVDDAMTQLKIVTQGTDAEMKRFFDASADSATKLGKSVSDVLDSVQTFSRLGLRCSPCGQ